MPRFSFENSVVIVVLASVFFLTSWALFIGGLFPVHDFIHAARIAEMALAFEAGHFPPRWSANFGFGYGMPLFNFYAPLPTWFGTILYQLNVGVEWAVKSMFLLANIGTAIGAYLAGYHLWRSRWSGLLTSIVFTLAPYRALNLFVRGAVSEAWGMMFVTWVTLGLLLTVRSKTGGWVVLSVSLAGLVLSHNLSALMLMLVLPLLTLGLWWSHLSDQQVAVLRSVVQKSRSKWLGFVTQQLPTIARLAVTGLFGLGLAAFYWLPAYVEKDLTQVDQITAGYFAYDFHFLYIRQFFNPIWAYGGSGWGPEDGMSFFIGWGGLFSGLSLAVVGIWFVWSAIKTRNNKSKYRPILSPQQVGVLVILGFTLLVALGLSLLRSKPLWDLIELFAFLQFPWRWLSVSSWVLALLVGVIPVVRLPQSAKTDFRYLRVVLVGLIVVGSVFGAVWFRPKEYLQDAEALYYTDPYRIATEMSGILPDYLPVGLPQTITPPNQLVGLSYQDLIDQDETAQAEVLINDPHQKLVSFQTTQPTELTWAVANFAGWRAEVDGQPIQHTTNNYGLIVTPVPAGDSTVGLKFGYSSVRLVAEGVTGLSLLALLVASVWQKSTLSLVKT